jgi:hypothetical protein
MLDASARGIAETAQRIRDAGDDAAAEAYLRNQLGLSRERRDLAGEVTALSWLATTVSFASRRAEGRDYARQAYEASAQLDEVERVKSGLLLAGLLIGDPDSFAEAQSLLERLRSLIADSRLDSRYEDMRLQRLESTLRRAGQTDAAGAVAVGIGQLRAAGNGFSGSQPEERSPEWSKCLPAGRRQVHSSLSAERLLKRQDVGSV